MINKQGATVYAGLITLLSEEMARFCELIKEGHRIGNLLTVLLRLWQEHLIAMQMIRDVLLYIDFNYIPREKLTKVYDLGLNHFNDEVVRNATIQPALQIALIMMVDPVL